MARERGADRWCHAHAATLGTTSTLRLRQTQPFVDSAGYGQRTGTPWRGASTTAHRSAVVKSSQRKGPEHGNEA
jgi:hypothetical protein